MSASYKCDRCGQFRDGNPVRVTWYADWLAVGNIDLCPECAPAVLAPLQAIAKTTHEGEE